MKRLLYATIAATLALLPASASELKAKDPQTGKAPRPVIKPAVAAEAESCGSFGTSVHFLDSPTDAAKKALKEEKLVMVLHVSGHFEDPRYT